jgi:hypothetical protein
MKYYPNSKDIINGIKSIFQNISCIENLRINIPRSPTLLQKQRLLPTTHSQPKITNPNSQPSFTPKNKIARLNIPMHNIPPLQILQPRQNLPQNLNNLMPIKVVSLLDNIEEIVAG